MVLIIHKVVFFTVFLFFQSWTVQPWDWADTTFQHHLSCLQDGCCTCLYALCHCWSMTLFLDLRLNHYFFQSATHCLVVSLSFMLFLCCVYPYIFENLCSHGSFLLFRLIILFKSQTNKSSFSFFLFWGHWLHIYWTIFSPILFLFCLLTSLDAVFSS